MSIGTTIQHETMSADEAWAIAKEAYIYGCPTVDNYRMLYAYMGCLGSRTTGHDGSSYLIAGRDWNGELPGGIKPLAQA